MKRAFAFVLILIILALSIFYVGFQPKRRGAQEARMFQGLRTVIYHVDDLSKAKEWYTNLLGVKPYFDEPFYVGFNVGGYELGLDPDVANVSKGDNVVAYWGVADARAAYRRAQELGAGKHTEPQDVGGGIIVATVTDPFGNLFGIIQNPHFKAGEETRGE